MNIICVAANVWYNILALHKLVLPLLVAELQFISIVVFLNLKIYT